ncbi:MAG: hypothetical protein EA355_16060 [Rhodobacteraceae bacterium]|nr:MAG: hypothetical protein EA355_16060 [Paracoccaceae bacterium]
MRLAIAAALMALLFGKVMAAPLDGGAIRGFIVGATVSGSMRDTGRFEEFFAPDGTIRGRGYSGRWSIAGDRLCLDYGDGPSCWRVEAEGDAVRWLENGGVAGTGRVTPGNPNGF